MRTAISVFYCLFPVPCSLFPVPCYYMRKFLLVSDLDDTLVGDDVALNALNSLLIEHKQAYNLKIAYITGRSLEDYYHHLKSKRPLLDPDFIATSVGTEIYVSGDSTPDSDWSKYLCDGWNRQLIGEILAQFPPLIPQPQKDQREFKMSYYLQPEAATTVLPSIQSCFQERGLSAQIIYSSGRDLDILPKNGNKGQTMQYLRKKLEISADNTVACGDSGNDRALFEGRTEKGIIVGNARVELRDWHLANPSDHRYLATGYYAEGVLEGLRYFGFLG